MNLEAHKYANIYSVFCPDNEKKIIEDSILKHGQLQPIILHEGKILDGRVRYDILKKHRLPITTKDFSELKLNMSALDYVLAISARKNYSPNQRDCAALEYKKILTEEYKKNPRNKPGDKLGRS